jgi:hypothetical protein
VEVFAAGFEDFGVAFYGGVVDEDDEDGRSPPGVEGLVGLVFQAHADELERFEVDEFLVADLAFEGAVEDGRGEFFAHEGGDLLAAVLAEGGAADVCFEVAGFEVFLAGGAFEEAFGEQRLEGFCQVEGEGVAAAVGVGVEEADRGVEWCAAQCGQDAGVDE